MDQLDWMQVVPRRFYSCRLRATKPDPVAYTEVLAELEIPKSTFFRWKATGQAPRTIKLPNGSLRIRRRDLDAWLAEREEPRPA